MKEKKVPGVEVPAITLEPPYQMTKATPRPPKNSITGEERALALTVFISSRKSLRVLWKKRRFS